MSRPAPPGNSSGRKRLNPTGTEGTFKRLVAKYRGAAFPASPGRPLPAQNHSQADFRPNGNTDLAEPERKVA
jgi:hypothetical protein